jgi:hypothetical protein
MMKKKLCVAATIVVVLFVSACTLQNREACYVNEKHNGQPVPQTDLYNSQIPVKSQDLNINRQNSVMPTSTGIHSDKYKMLYQNPNSGTESTGPR